MAFDFNRIWAGTQLQIAERCSALYEFEVDYEESIRLDHLSYLRERRQAIARGIPGLPKSLKVFRSNADLDRPFIDVWFALNVLPDDGIDLLAENLRELGMNLRNLYTCAATLPLEFLFPLDVAGNPAAQSSSLHWPYLETLILTGVPEYTPSGEWLLDFHFDPEEQEDEDEPIPDPRTAGPELFETEWAEEENTVDRNIMHTEHFHRLFISLGHAARRMPRLKRLDFALASGGYVDLTFESARYRGSGSGSGSGSRILGKPNLDIRSKVGYLPDERVQRVWGFRLADANVEDDGPDVYGKHWTCMIVDLERFPPAESSESLLYNSLPVDL